MTPELKQRIEKEAKDHCDLQYGDRAAFHYKDPIKVLWQNEFDGFVAGATVWAEEAERLERWKTEASKLLDTLFEYGRQHPDIKLGESRTEFILNRAKAYDAVLEELARLKFLVQLAYQTGWHSKSLGDSKLSISWEEFKIENNL